MKAWTLRQPWATLAVLGEKRWETRSRPNRKIIGERLAIHASKKPFPELLDEDGCFSDRHMANAFGKFDTDPDMLPLGSVVGFVTVTSCQRVEGIRCILNSDQLAFGNFSDGRYCFSLVNPQMIEPVPAKGALSVWEWDMQGYYPGSEPLASYHMKGTGYDRLLSPHLYDPDLLNLEYPHLE
jgi:activating signal cointegrator 1